MSEPENTEHGDARSVRVFAAGAVKAVVLDLSAPFEERTGWRLDITFDTVGALAERVLRNEPADVVLLSLPALETLASKGFGPRGVLRLGTTGVALGGGRERAGETGLGSLDTFRALLLEAEAIGYADPSRGATAGRHFTAVLDQLGLIEDLKPKLRMFPFGVDAVEALARGEVDLAVSQATEIITHPGVTMLGLFPPPFDLTTAYGATALSDTDGARRFLLKLQEPLAAAALRRAGFT